MDAPAIQLIKLSDGVTNNNLIMAVACELYLRVKSIGGGPVFIRTATRNANYEIKLLGDKVISSYSSAEAGQLRDRLRAVEYPSDIVDATRGWETSGVGYEYWDGNPLEVSEKWMINLVRD